MSSCWCSFLDIDYWVYRCIDSQRRNVVLLICCIIFFCRVHFFVLPSFVFRLGIVWVKMDDSRERDIIPDQEYRCDQPTGRLTYLLHINHVFVCQDIRFRILKISFMFPSFASDRASAEWRWPVLVQRRLPGAVRMPGGAELREVVACRLHDRCACRRHRQRSVWRQRLCRGRLLSQLECAEPTYVVRVCNLNCMLCIWFIVFLSFGARLYISVKEYYYHIGVENTRISMNL